MGLDIFAIAIEYDTDWEARFTEALGGREANHCEQAQDGRVQRAQSANPRQRLDGC